MQKDSKIYIAGHRGTAGSALLENLKKQGFNNLIYKTHQELDLVNQEVVKDFFKKEKPEFVFLAAVKLAHLGIKNNAMVLYENLMIQNNIIHNAYVNEVSKLIFYGSSWMYPQKCINPISENSLLESALDSVALPYALSKIAGFKLCEAYNTECNTNFLLLVLPNLYGNSMDYDFLSAKVLPALLRKIHLAKLLSEGRDEEVLKDLNTHAKTPFANLKEAKAYLQSFGVSEKSVEIWGTGKVRREFIHSDDLSDASIYFMQNIAFKDLYKKNPINTHINIGTGISYTIKEVAELVKELVGFKGELVFNANRPDSTMDRLLDCTKAKNLGWQAKITLEQGVQMMYNNYVNNNGGGGINDLKFIFLNSFLIVYLFKDKLLKIQSNFFYLNFKIKPLNSISKIQKANGLKVA